MSFRKYLVGIGSLLTLFATSPVIADVSARYEWPKQQKVHLDLEMTIEMDGQGNLRIQMGDQPLYMLTLDGVSYWISRDHDGVLVARMEDLATVLGEVSSQYGFSGNEMDPKPGKDESKVAYVPMGQREVHGRAGIAYGTPYRGKPPEIAELVISDDARLAPLGQAFIRSIDQSAGMARKMFVGWGSALGAFDPLRELLSKGAPLQMMSYELTDVSFDPIDPARFRLPAEPVKIEQLRSQYLGFPPPPNLPPRKKP